MSKHAMESEDKKREKKQRKPLNKMIILIPAVIVIIAVIIFICFKFKDNILTGNTPQEKAISIAYKEFKSLGEKKVNKDNIELVEITRDGVKSFYVTYSDKSVEIQEDSLKVIKVNNKEK